MNVYESFNAHKINVGLGRFGIYEDEHGEWNLASSYTYWERIEEILDWIHKASVRRNIEVLLCLRQLDIIIQQLDS